MSVSLKFVKCNYDVSATDYNASDEVSFKLSFQELIKFLYFPVNYSPKKDRAELERMLKSFLWYVQRHIPVFMMFIEELGLYPSLRTFHFQNEIFKYGLSCIILLRETLIHRRYLQRYYGKLSEHLYTVSRLPEHNILPYKPASSNLKEFTLLDELQTKIPVRDGGRKLAPIGSPVAYEDELNRSTEFSDACLLSYVHEDSSALKFAQMNASDLPTDSCSTRGSGCKSHSTDSQGEYRLLDGWSFSLECVDEHTLPKSLLHEDSHASKIQNSDHSLYFEKTSPIYGFSKKQAWIRKDSGFSSLDDSFSSRSSSDESSSDALSNHSWNSDSALSSSDTPTLIESRSKSSVSSGYSSV